MGRSLSAGGDHSDPLGRRTAGRAAAGKDEQTIMTIAIDMETTAQTAKPAAKPVSDAAAKIAVRDFNFFYGSANVLRIGGMRNKTELNALVEKSLIRAALWDEVKDRLHESAFALSGGQQQRLCIARALAVDPEIVLMDEPASALDPIATTKIEELIWDLKVNYTIVIVTHNMQQAARVSDRTAFFMLGRLIEYTDTKTIFMNLREKMTEDYVTGRFG